MPRWSAKDIAELYKGSRTVRKVGKLKEGTIKFLGEVDVNPSKGTKMPVEIEIPFSVLEDMIDEDGEQTLEIPGLDEGVLQFVAQELSKSGVVGRTLPTGNSSGGSKKQRDDDDDDDDDFGGWTCPESGHDGKVRKNERYGTVECAFYEEFDVSKRNPPEEDDDLPSWSSEKKLWWDKDNKLYRAYCSRKKR